MIPLIRVMSLMIGLLCLGFYIYNKWSLPSPILFSTEYYWEEGVNIEFRENGTFKAMNFSIMEGSVSYGKYDLQDSLIILRDKIKFGNSYMKDTLIARKNGIYFSLKEPWRIEEDTMAYKYSPKTTFQVLNKTDTTVDSLNVKLSYTEKNINYQSLEPGENIDYVFDMENPHVDGKYYLTFNTIHRDTNKKTFIDITRGYPLETVKSISLFDDSIVVELIFGKSITTELFVK